MLFRRLEDFCSAYKHNLYIIVSLLNLTTFNASKKNSMWVSHSHLCVFVTNYTNSKALASWAGLSLLELVPANSYDVHHGQKHINQTICTSFSIGKIVFFSFRSFFLFFSITRTNKRAKLQQMNEKKSGASTKSLNFFSHSCSSHIFFLLPFAAHSANWYTNDGCCCCCCCYCKRKVQKRDTHKKSTQTFEHVFGKCN